MRMEDNTVSGNPSARRDGLAIRFTRENSKMDELTFAQHKGETMVAWRSWVREKN